MYTGPAERGSAGPVAGKVRWRRVRGPVSAAIATLLEGGWKCPSPQIWSHNAEDGEVEWRFPEATSPEFAQVDIEEIVDEFVQGLRLLQWASKCEGADDLQYGADMSQISRELH
eukprot:5375241-Pyramimonas_sp.AAC.1